MKKAERLFQIVTMLRGRRSVVTAKQLADMLEVTERTIYRDIQDLIYSGVPIDSEAGIGYRLKPKHSVPPLMFDETELEALLLGVRMVQGWSGESMAKAAESALNKIHSVLPENLHLKHVQKPEWLIVPNLDEGRSSKYNDLIADAIKNKLKCDLAYTREDGQQSNRIIWPLGVIYWGRTWTLIAWCEKRAAYRMFRLDRINLLKTLTDSYQTKPNLSLKHYLSLYCDE
ncbi:YafY family transcriptional regulator [Catenovulum sp. SM1970]|uniref:helix-turn-helix transcriptional regulator n=1 Tax=Marinifaba aquimaris TaxID=2741323 RepID=UPI001573C79F|nr:YafY family protein [Marinifaba aquimaris]NTS78294.1 YafY family transcriptional regulator [Marinifaba aquimaris]